MIRPLDLESERNHIRPTASSGGFFSGLLGCIVAAFINAAGAFVLLGGFTVCLIFLFLSQFKRFKGFGVEAETWEAKMNEAAALIARLDRLALTVAEISYLELAARGRLVSPIKGEALQQLVDKLDAILVEAGIEKTEIEARKQPIHWSNLTDITRDARAAVAVLVRSYMKVRTDRINELPRPISSDIAIEVSKMSAEATAIGTLPRRIEDALTNGPLEGAAARAQSVIDTADSLRPEEKAELSKILEPCLQTLRQYEAKKRWN